MRRHRRGTGRVRVQGGQPAARDREVLALLAPLPGLAALDEPFSAEEVSAAIVALNASASTSGVPLDALGATGAEGAAALAEWLNRCAAAVGGMGSGAVATIFAQTNQRLLPSATPDAEVWTGMVAGAFALVSNPFFALVDDASFEGDSLRGLGLMRLGVAGLLVGAG